MRGQAYSTSAAVPGWMAVASVVHVDRGKASPWLSLFSLTGSSSTGPNWVVRICAQRNWQDPSRDQQTIRSQSTRATAVAGARAHHRDDPRPKVVSLPSRQFRVSHNFPLGTGQHRHRGSAIRGKTLWRTRGRRTQRPRSQSASKNGADVRWVIALEGMEGTDDTSRRGENAGDRRPSAGTRVVEAHI